MIINTSSIPNRQKDDALYKVLALEPEPLNKIVNITGWGQEVTEQTLYRLISNGRVTYRNRQGHRVYEVIIWFTHYKIMGKTLIGAVCGNVRHGASQNCPRVFPAIH